MPTIATITAPLVGAMVTTGANVDTTLAVPTPTGVKAGDVLELSVATTAASATADATFTPPPGYALPGPNFAIRQGTAQLAVYFKVADATDTAAPARTVGVAGHAGRLEAQIIARPGGSVPTNADGLSGVNATSTATFVGGPLTFSKAGWFAMSTATRSGFNWIPGTGLVERGDLEASSNTGLGVFDSGAEVAAGSVSRTVTSVTPGTTTPANSSNGVRIAWAVYPAVIPDPVPVSLLRAGGGTVLPYAVGGLLLEAAWIGDAMVYGIGAGSGGGGGTTPPPTFVAVTDFGESYRPQYVRENAGAGKIAPYPTEYYDPTGSAINTISTSGGLYENKIFRNRVVVTGSNNTFKNCVFWGLGIVSDDERHIIDCSGGHNTIIEHCDVFSKAAIDAIGTGVYYSGINGIGTKNFKSHWNNVHHCVDPIRVNTTGTTTDALMFESVGDWLHDILLVTPDAAYLPQTRADNKTHSDGIQIQSGANGSIRYDVIDGMHSTDGSSNVTRTSTTAPYPPVDSGGAPHPQALSCIIITNDGFDNLELVGVHMKGGEVAFNGTDGLTNSRMTNCKWEDGTPYALQINNDTNGYMYPRNPAGLTKTGNRLATANTLI